MSDTGLYGGLYEQLRTYADRFDNNLIAIKGDSEEISKKARHDIANLLREIRNTESANPITQFIGVVIDQELSRVSSKDPARWTNLVLTLDSRSPTPFELSQLEQIAAVLDQECISTLARMRGQT